MSREVDERIVEMRLENAQFQREIRKTIKSLDNLNDTLQMEQASRGFDRLQNEVNRFDFGKFGAGVDMIGDKFNNIVYMFEHEFKARIVDKTLNWMERLGKSMSFDQITAGMSKYEEKTNAVKTIMNATGLEVEEVEKYLEELMWYSDETSYSFTDMTNALSKFTSNGGKIEEIVPMLEGIANATAHAGQNATAFSSSLLNLSQSYGSGALQAIDAKSLVNQNVLTTKLKEVFIEQAKVLGTLDEQGRTIDKKIQVTTGNFMDTLKEDWATKDVMLAAYKKYAEYTQIVRDTMLEKGYDTASDTMEELDKLGGMYDGLGKDAFKAAQSAKTFTDAINATKDAVSSSWLKIYGKIFGNVEEATEIWTDFTDRLWELFAGPIEALNEVFDKWLEFDGRINLIEAFQNAWDNVAKAISLFKEEWGRVFPTLTGESLAKFTENLKVLTNRLMIFDKNTKELNSSGKTLKKVFAGIADFFGIFRDLLSVIVGEIKTILNDPEISKMKNEFLGFIVQLLENISDIRKKFQKDNTFKNFLDPIANSITRFIQYAGPKMTEIIKMVKSFTNELSIRLGALGKVKWFPDLNAVNNPTFLDGVRIFFEAIGNMIYELSAVIAGTDTDSLKEAATGVGDICNWFVKFCNDSILPALENLFNFMQTGTGLAVGIGAVVLFLLSRLKGRMSIFTAIKTIAGFLKDVPSTMQMIKSRLIKTTSLIITSIFLILVALRLVSKSITEIATLATTNEKGFTTAIITLVGIITIVTVLSVVMAKLTQSMDSVKGIGTLLLGLGASMWLIANSLTLIASLDSDEFAQALIVMVLIGAYIGAIVALATKHESVKLTGFMTMLLGVGIATKLIASAFRQIMIALQTLDPSNIPIAVGILAGIGVLLYALTNVITKEAIPDVNYSGIGIAILGMAIAIKLIVGSLIDIYDVINSDNFNGKAFGVACAVIGAALLAMIGLVYVMTKTKPDANIWGFGIAFLAMAAVIATVVGALLIVTMTIGKMTATQLAAFTLVSILMVAVIGLFIGLAAVMTLMKKDSSGILQMAVVFLAIGAAIASIFLTMALLTSIVNQSDDPVNTIGMMIALFATIAVLLTGISVVASFIGKKYKDIMLFGAAFAIIAAAISIVLVGLAHIVNTGVKISDIALLAAMFAGIGIVIAAILVIATNFVKDINKVILFSAAFSLIAVSLSLILISLAAASSILNKDALESLLGAITVVGLIIVALLVIVGVLGSNPMILAAIGILTVLLAVVGASFVALLYMIEKFMKYGSAKVTSMFKALSSGLAGLILPLIGFFGALAVGIIAIPFLTSIVPLILAFGTAVAGIAAAFTAVVTFFGAVTKFDGKRAGKNIEDFLKYLGEAFEHSASSLESGVNTLVDSIANIIHHFAEKIKQTVTDDLPIIMQSFKSAASTLKAYVGPIARDLGYAIVDGIIQGITGGLNAAADNMGDLSAAAGKFKDSLWDSMNPLKKIGNKVKGIFSKGKAAVEVGEFVTKGVAQGMNSASSIGSLDGAATSVVDTIYNGMSNKAEIHSPSRLFARLAEYIPMGAAVGIQNGSKYAIDSATQMMDSMKDSFDIKPMSEELETDMDILTKSIGNASNDMSVALRPVYDDTAMGSISNDVKSMMTADLAAKVGTDVEARNAITMHHTFDKLVVQGVNDRQEIVDVVEFTLDSYLAGLVERQSRM